MENLFFFLPGIRAGNDCCDVNRRRIERRRDGTRSAVGLKVGRPLEGYPAAWNKCKNEWRGQLMVRTEMFFGVGGF